MPFPDADRYDWFENHTRTVLAACRRVVEPVPGLSDEPMAVQIPGGDDKYPSFWVRDAVMQCRSGLIPVAEMRGMLEIMLAFQNGPAERQLAHGLRVPPWAIADHINLPGLGTPEAQPPGAVFFPGTYQSGDDQGNGAFGMRPADDSAYEVIDLAHLLLTELGFQRGQQLLAELIESLPIITRLHKAWDALPVDADTHLPHNSAEAWGASSFQDALRIRGLVTLPGVFRARAARRMVTLCEVAGRPAAAELYRSHALELGSMLAEHCQLPSGWLMFGTEVDRQPDTWSTLHAIYEGILPPSAHEDACMALQSGYRAGTAVDRDSGYIRHTPTSADAEPGVRIYEHQTGSHPCDTYQTGGYWPQCVGYYCWALRQVEPRAARQLAATFIDHTRAHAEAGAPFEWLHPVGGIPANGHLYGPSAALPLEVFRRLG